MRTIRVRHLGYDTEYVALAHEEIRLDSVHQGSVWISPESRPLPFGAAVDLASLPFAS